VTKLVYEVVEHDGGWAYKLGDVFSEPYPTHDAARAAAERAAAEQQLGGRDEAIEYQDRDGIWHEEQVRGGDRPEVEVKDDE
jgi:hypothetical protein